MSSIFFITAIEYRMTDSISRVQPCCSRSDKARGGSGKNGQKTFVWGNQHAAWSKEQTINCVRVKSPAVRHSSSSAGGLISDCFNLKSAHVMGLFMSGVTLMEKSTCLINASTATDKRQRATKYEMQLREEFVVEFARQFAPVTVRQVFYAATVQKVVEKTEDGYNKIQSMCLQARRRGILSYQWIADNSRTVYRLTSYDDLSNAADSFASSYRRNFWSDFDYSAEVWLEKEALAGTILPVTKKYRVRLVPTRGYASETILHSAVEQAHYEGKQKLYIFTLYDFDRSGQDARAAVARGLEEMGRTMFGVEVDHRPIALTHQQVMDMTLPSRPPKRTSGADKNWPYPIAVELDAMPPDVLRGLVQAELEELMPDHFRRQVLAEETRERAKIRMALSEF